MPGYLELADGKVRPGQLMMTRGARLKILDEQQKEHHLIPLETINRVDCSVVKEWIEEEWRFKENASNEKYFTGRTYAVREYNHTVTLQNGQNIEGTVSGIIYVRTMPDEEAERYVLHERDKGEPGSDLKSLVYVRSIQVGEKALEEGKKRPPGAKESLAPWRRSLASNECP